MNERFYVLYHRDTDGFGAAYAAWKHWRDAAEYISVQYKEPLPEIEPGSDVVFVDFCPEESDLLNLIAISKSVIVIDHHKSHQELLTGMPTDIPNFQAIFDIEKSGAVLTWEYFNNDPVPELLLYIQDRDLWKWSMSNSKAHSAGLALHGWDFMAWDMLDSKELIKEGSHVHRYINQRVEEIADRAELTVIDGHEVPIAGTSLFQSEVGHVLLKKYPDSPFSVTFFDFHNHDRVMSLRSRPGGFDVGEFAKANGGGGHAAAAGYKIISPPS